MLSVSKGLALTLSSEGTRFIHLPEFSALSPTAEPILPELTTFSLDLVYTDDERDAAALVFRWLGTGNKLRHFATHADPVGAVHPISWTEVIAGMRLPAMVNFSLVRAPTSANLTALEAQDALVSLIVACRRIYCSLLSRQLRTALRERSINLEQDTFELPTLAIEDEV